MAHQTINQGADLMESRPSCKLIVHMFENAFWKGKVLSERTHWAFDCPFRPVPSTVIATKPPRTQNMSVETTPD